MFKLLKKLTGASKVAKLWVKALDCASVNNDQESMTLLHEIYATLGAKGPSKKAASDINLLFAHVASKLELDDLVIEAIRIVVAQIGTERGYSEADKGYLLYYAAKVLEYRDIPESALGIAFSYPAFGDICFDSVKSYLKRNSPVRGPLASQRKTLH